VLALLALSLVWLHPDFLLALVLASKGARPLLGFFWFFERLDFG
jgi:hypothetical protein